MALLHQHALRVPDMRVSPAIKSEWVDRIKLQCDRVHVAFFFKQWGAWGADGRKRSKKANGRRFCGRGDLRVRLEFPKRKSSLTLTALG